MEVSTTHRFEDEWLPKALIDYKIISKSLLDELRARFPDQKYFMDVLIDNNYLGLEEIAVFVENAIQIPYVNLDQTEIDASVIKLIPEPICLKHRVFPFSMKKEHLSLAVTNPFDLDAEKEIAYIAGKLVKPFFAFKDQVNRKIEEYYSPDKFISSLVDNARIEKAVTLQTGENGVGDSPVVRLANMIIGDAISQDASDIHIETKEKAVVVRYRVDGILRNILEIPKSVHSSLVSRIKILSNLNIAESRKPQDGKAKVVHNGADIDLRISVLPTNYGEKVVIRILDSRKASISFPKLGLSGQRLRLLESCFSRTQGLILVTGPTGSGKTTTLYAAINRIRNTANNILTIEDPIEYLMDGINQVQVNEKSGITFASALRSFLRQDPDVILVGEIRDQETAEIAIQAALTGHLVLSTLHTNDSLGAITRLADMGVDVYKIASSLEAIIAQRLIRTLCPDCKLRTEPDEVERKLIPLWETYGIEPNFYHSNGCPACGFTGYKGRVGVYEILHLDERLKDMIAAGVSMYSIRNAARMKGFRNLYEDALRHIGEGDTDYKEILRVINPQDLEEGIHGTGRRSAQVEVNESIPLQKPSFDSEPDSRPDFAEGVREDFEHKNFEPNSDSREKSPARILLVEDNDSMRKMIRLLVGKETDWELCEAEDGLKAIESINREKPDVIVLDIMMPNMNGYELLTHLRKNLATAAIPVLVLTALNGADHEVKSLSLGADDYVCKPYNPRVLLARISRLLMRSNPRMYDIDLSSGPGRKPRLRLL